ncbi:NAD(P)-dependent oxidoreductase [Umezawaea sp. Da 62-37]|uniref:NAD(P)-dependent oxidoreductase n=1 Tax=Umezawaea sp. Da 62-37 TaxID=3075927 RepID=UPI0028F70E8D|nr:NAD(P)-dependent oxidoreductase [Umezawaea sp. Da 62-37]WNV83230.1 NAD(P)-dependent oxidoreductase [Umezawaea sp. Da 62-37]
MNPVKILVSSETDDKSGAVAIAAIPGVELVDYDPNQPTLTDRQREAEIFLPPFRGSDRPIRLLQGLPKLRMVQLLSAGVDEWENHVPGHVTFASARGAHARPVSEWVVSAILTQLRQWPTLIGFKESGVWAHRMFDADTLAGKKVLIVGAGAIGKAVAARLEVFEATSTLVASTAREGVYSYTALPDLIHDHDIVVITAPLTETTRSMVNSDFLSTMHDGAILVNVGRGQIVDTAALVVELQSGRLRAALDVTDPEPLPAGHPLWDCPGLIISPHSARTVPGTNLLCYGVAAEQIRTFITGGIPSNIAR